MMTFKNACFSLSAAQANQFPKDEGIEIAFAGRSNAGKSSALNALTMQKTLARTSKTPGRTQQINFFTIKQPDATIKLVDLPGYGYAKVPLPLKHKWEGLITSYLEQRQSLRGLVLLMDIRHPFTELDWQLIDFCAQYQLLLHILLTKADKLSRGAALNELHKASLTLKTSEINPENISIQLFSSFSKMGLDEFVTKLNSWITA